MEFQLPDKNTLYYEHHHTSGDLPTFVLLNGLTQSTIAWGGMAHVLQEWSNVLLYDMVFQGQSTQKGPYRSFQQHAKDLTALLDYLGLNKVHIVGISYGGFVAQYMLHEHSHRVSSATILASAAFKTEHFKLIEQSWWATLEQGGYDHFVDILLPWVLSPAYMENPVIPLDQLKEIRAQNPMNKEQVAKLMEATRQWDGMPKDKRPTECPVHVIGGSADPLFPMEVIDATADYWSGKAHILKGKGHTLNLEAIPELVQLLKQLSTESA